MELEPSTDVTKQAFFLTGYPGTEIYLAGVPDVIEWVGTNEIVVLRPENQEWIANVENLDSVKYCTRCNDEIVSPRWIDDDVYCDDCAPEMGID